MRAMVHYVLVLRFDQQGNFLTHEVEIDYHHGRSIFHFLFGKVSIIRIIYIAQLENLVAFQG